MRLFFAFSFLGFFLGCGDDASPARDAATPRDGGVREDGGRDSGSDPTDGGGSDAGFDGGSDAGTPDAGPRCFAPHECPALERPGVAWANDFSGGPAYIGDVAIDASGDIVIGGAYVGDVDFGDGPLVLSGERNLFVARFDADGTLEWAVRFVCSDRDVSLNGVAIDADGHVYAAGWGAGTIDFGDGPVMGPFAGGLRPGFVVELDETGGFVWQRRFAMLSFGQVRVDSMSRPVALGVFNGEVNVGVGDPHRSTAGGADLLLLGMNGDGTSRFARVLGESDAVDPSGALAIGTDDDLYVGAGFYSSTGGEAGIWLARLDGDGVQRWRRRDVAPLSPITPQVLGLDVGPSGSPVVMGHGEHDFGEGRLAGAWIARFAASDGAFEWSDPYGANAIAVDESDRVWFASTWSSVGLSIRPDPCFFAGEGSGDMVTRLEADGTRSGFAAFDAGGTMAMDARGGRVVLGGRTFMDGGFGCGMAPADFEEPFLFSLLGE
jgi:hypothetical protein